MGFKTAKAPNLAEIAPPPPVAEAELPISVEEIKNDSAVDMESKKKRKKGIASTILSEMMGALGDRSSLGGLS